MLDNKAQSNNILGPLDKITRNIVVEKQDAIGKIKYCCIFCYIAFYNIDDVLTHVAIKHNLKELDPHRNIIYTCEFCGSGEFINLVSVKMHSRICSKNPDGRCGYCGELIGENEAHRVMCPHYMNKHIPETNKCSYCGQEPHFDINGLPILCPQYSKKLYSSYSTAIDPKYAIENQQKGSKCSYCDTENIDTAYHLETCVAYKEAATQSIEQKYTEEYYKYLISKDTNVFNPLTRTSLPTPPRPGNEQDTINENIQLKNMIEELRELNSNQQRTILVFQQANKHPFPVPGNRYVALEEAMKILKEHFQMHYINDLHSKDSPQEIVHKAIQYVEKNLDDGRNTITMLESKVKILQEQLKNVEFLRNYYSIDHLKTENLQAQEALNRIDTFYINNVSDEPATSQYFIASRVNEWIQKAIAELRWIEEEANRIAYSAHASIVQRIRSSVQFFLEKNVKDNKTVR